MATIFADHFGSVERRRAQAERDEQASDAPVGSAFSGGAPGYALALRPLEERIERATPRPKTPAEREARWLRKQFRKGRLNKAQARRMIANSGSASSPASR